MPAHILTPSLTESLKSLLLRAACDVVCVFCACQLLTSDDPISQVWDCLTGSMHQVPRVLENSLLDGPKSCRVSKSSALHTVCRTAVRNISSSGGCESVWTLCDIVLHNKVKNAKYFGEQGSSENVQSPWKPWDIQQR